jgi:hypothetical protein
MMRRCARLWQLVAAAAAIQASSCQHGNFQGMCRDGECPGHAQTCVNPTVRALAHDLDQLETHIERDGSIVVQHPTVWGQARLTKHREDFEREMFKDIDNFKLQLQGSLFRSDQAYFANAFALSAATSQASGRRAVVNNNNASSSSKTDAAPAAGFTPPGSAEDDIPQDTFAAFTSMSRTPVASATKVGFASMAAGGIGLEPSIYLDQKARFLNHLNELRRMNEGDDTGDSPGYSLNLVRLPVSVLPGKCTDQGFGAEITLTMRPYLGDDLLPTTYRNLVVNDLVDQLGVPITELLNEPEAQEALYALAFAEEAQTPRVGERLDRIDKAKMRALPRPAAKTVEKGDLHMPRLLSDAGKADLKVVQRTREAYSTLRTRVDRLTARIPATRLRRARRPFPPSQIPDVYGLDECIEVAAAVMRVYSYDLPNTYITHYTDVQGFLQEELAGAYKFLAQPHCIHLWDYCAPVLVQAIRARQVAVVAEIRGRFFAAAAEVAGGIPRKDVTIPLAWAVLVESALLNDQLMQDMKEAAANKGCPCAPGDWLPFFLPQPPPEARQAFNAYVACRWPIIVFALDPAAEQQNIADEYSQRREMQLAMSMAFVSGNVSARNMMRYARRLETEMETIALNQTAIGFSHGNDTFGWRFYPRMQTPDIEGNATVLVRDLLIGGPRRDALLRQRKLEPGIRECVAIVIMPSFVPYATLDIGTTWFDVANPKRKRMSSTDAVKLSARVQALQNCGGQVVDGDCYRPGEVGRLLERARQLETRLPLQTLQFQVPYENTLGGFAMFNTGITDLAPELHGWYGATAINLDEPTTLFLIGNHFSVHQTRIVAGGVEALKQEMLSRQVIKVTIPAGAKPIMQATGFVPGCNPWNTSDSDVKKYPHDLFVDVHIATPYGVTSHLLIPACGGPAHTEKHRLAWADDKLGVGYVFVEAGIAAPAPPQLRPRNLRLDVSKYAALDIAGATVDVLVKIESEKLKTEFLREKIAIDATGSVVLDDNDVLALSKKIFEAFGTQFDVNNKPAPVALDDTLLILKQGDRMIRADPPANQLTIYWIDPK